MSEEDDDRRVAIERALVIADGVRLLASTQRSLVAALAVVEDASEDEARFFVRGIAITRAIVHAERMCAQVQEHFVDEDWPAELIREQVFAGLDDYQKSSPAEYVRLVMERLSLLGIAYSGLYKRLVVDLDLPALDVSELAFDETAFSQILDEE